MLKGLNDVVVDLFQNLQWLCFKIGRKCTAKGLSELPEFGQI